MFENAPNGVLIIDGSATVVLASSLLESMFGYARRKLIGQSVDKLFSEQLDFALARPLLETKDGRSLFARRNDGTEFPVEIGYNSLTIGTSKLIRVAVVDIWSGSCPKSASLARLQNVIDAPSADAGAGRRRAAAGTRPPRPDRSGAHGCNVGPEGVGAASCRERAFPAAGHPDPVRENGETLHRVVWELRPAAIDDLGLAAVLASYVEEWNIQYGIRADFHCRDTLLDTLPVDVRTTLYRLVQEALTNIAKTRVPRPRSVSSSTAWGPYHG